MPECIATISLTGIWMVISVGSCPGIRLEARETGKWFLFFSSLEARVENLGEQIFVSCNNLYIIWGRESEVGWFLNHLPCLEAGPLRKSRIFLQSWLGSVAAGSSWSQSHLPPGSSTPNVSTGKTFSRWQRKSESQSTTSINDSRPPCTVKLDSELCFVRCVWGPAVQFKAQPHCLPVV